MEELRNRGAGPGAGDPSWSFLLASDYNQCPMSEPNAVLFARRALRPSVGTLYILIFCLPGSIIVNFSHISRVSLSPGLRIRIHFHRQLHFHIAYSNCVSVSTTKPPPPPFDQIISYYFCHKCKLVMSNLHILHST